MPRSIIFYAKHVFGIRKLYPANEDAKLLAELAGTTTLLPRHIELARELGFAAEEVALLSDGSFAKIAMMAPRPEVSRMSRADEAVEAGRRG